MISRPLKAGDVVVAGKVFTDLTEGKSYTIRIDVDGDCYLLDDEADRRWIYEEDYSHYTLKEDVDNPGYISIREWSITEGEPTIMTLEVDEEGYETILAITKSSEEHRQRRLLKEQIATLEQRLSDLDKK